MKCIIAKEPLLEALQNIQNIVNAKTTIPILNNTLMSAKNGKVTFTSTDLDIGLKITLDATVEKSGVTTLPARALFSIVRELAFPEVSIEVDAKHSTRIQSGHADFKLFGLSEAEFPSLPKAANAKTFKIKQKVLRNMIKKTAYAMSEDESRQILNGLFFQLAESKLTVVATDGRRMALVEEELEFPKSSEGGVIISAKTVHTLNKILKEDDSEVAISIAENVMTFDVGGTEYLVTKLVEGKYPNYQQVIPSEAKERIILNREEFLDAVRRVSVVTSEKTNTLKIFFTKNKVFLSVNAPDIAEAKESLDTKYKGKDFTIAFNPSFLMEPLKAIEGEQFFFDFIDELSPGVIKYDKPFLYVIMPMRTS